MERELRENPFGEAAWTALDVGTRAFIVTAERIFRDNRGNAAFDFAPVLTSFAKALEVEANRRVRVGLTRAAPSSRMALIEGQTIDVTTRSLTLGQLARVLGGEGELRQALTDRMSDGGWFTGSFAVTIDGLRDIRNAGAHEARIDRATAVQWRDRLVGVGEEGVLPKLAGVRLKPR